MKTEQIIDLHIEKNQEGTYFPVAVQVPDGVERLDVTYHYTRKTERTDGPWRIQEEINIVDLALSAPGDDYVGASGSDRSHVWVCAAGSAQGYASVPVVAGEWSILVGAYKIAEGGVDVRYTVTCTQKELRLFQGDTHTHTLGSDGTMTMRELSTTARSLGLDYLFITDHNNFAQNEYAVDVDGITVLPGTEWTHYKGHCGMLGVKRPYWNAFCVNSREEAVAKVSEAKAHGALIVLNHAFCPFCGWKWGFEGFDYDAVELWNGGCSPQSTLDCLAWWHAQLCAGEKLSITGGSDFHSLEFLRLIASPCMCLYAMSREPGDLLAALKSGNGYISYMVGGPGISAQAGAAILGQTTAETAIHTEWFHLRGGDTLRAITNDAVQETVCPAGASSFTWDIPRNNARFCRFEIWRALVPGIPSSLAMVSNPIYFQ